MDNLISLYQQRFNLQNAIFSLIEHEEAMVATVYRVTQPSGMQLILKIYTRHNDYLREKYFLTYLERKLPVPRILQIAQPEKDIYGSILMECLPGTLLKIKDFTDTLAYEMGSLLARIHTNSTAGYGDLIQPNDLRPDPRLHFTQKFEEGLDECSNHLPKALLEQCRQYYDAHLDLFDLVDGPCIVHRDFRPGNVIVNEGKIQGIIDWAGGRASFAQEDFVHMEHEERPMFSAKKEPFIAGYASIRPVPNYMALMPFLRLCTAVATIGFLVKRRTWATSHTRLYQFNRQFLEALFKP